MHFALRIPLCVCLCFLALRCVACAPVSSLPPSAPKHRERRPAQTTVKTAACFKGLRHSPLDSYYDLTQFNELPAAYQSKSFEDLKINTIGWALGRSNLRGCKGYLLMEPRICVNIWCRATLALEWRKGWPLQSGEYVDLCDQCGSAYDNSVFCETFHTRESGWRDCNYCQKRIHCGCIVSRQLFDHLDYGGIKCTDCPKSGQLLTFSLTGIRRANEDRSMHLSRFMDSGENSLLPQPQIVEPYALPVEANHDLMNLLRDTGADIPNVVQPSIGTSSEDDNIKLQDKLKDLKKSLSHTPVNIDQGDPIGDPNLAVPIEESHQQESEPCTTPAPAPVPFPFVQGVCSHPILPSLSNPGISAVVETSKLTIPQVRVARPPAEGRGKNQLLPRYWPRITDQELKQLSGDLNSNIVPLFEKVLSASDAGRIGRLVLPKACAEAYFPSISQSEGVPVRIQDVKGNEWTFQFRFWPNNNSRMYVLEGVTPCIQAMHLRAGDTVIFSRINPGSKLVMGFRKSSHNVQPQSNGTSSGTPSRAFLGNVVGAYADAVNGTKDSLPNSPFENLNGAGDDASQHGSGAIVGSDDATRLPVVSGKKKTRNIGLKSRRTLMHNEDVMEVRLTWEEAQDLLRPPPNANPNVVTVEGHDFEEYDEPPVFGKRTLYISRSSGDQEQWAQCDDCSKWRRLSIDDLLPSKWTCSDNISDPVRRCCSAPDEMTPKELDGLLRLSRDSKKRRLAENQNGSSTLDNETCGLDALARIAALGESMEEPLGPGETSLGPTTKHPRHRAGCSCIVCIQPPSGKGKHKPTCTCNVCMTVKRRFKTLMLRKKKQHWERTDFVLREVTDVASSKGGGVAATENGSSNGQIDLNCDPDKEDVEGSDDGVQKTHDDIYPSCHVVEDHLTRQTSSSNFLQDHTQPLDILNFHELGLDCMAGAAIDNNEKHLEIQKTDEDVIGSLGQKNKSGDSL